MPRDPKFHYPDETPSARYAYAQNLREQWAAERAAAREIESASGIEVGVVEAPVDVSAEALALTVTHPDPTQYVV